MNTPHFSRFAILRTALWNRSPRGASLRTPALLVTALLLTSMTWQAQAGDARPRTPWVGSVRCEIQVEGSGYLHQETHLWTLDATSVDRGSRENHRVETAWTATGQGWSRRRESALTYKSDWAIDGRGAGSFGFEVNPTTGGIKVRVQPPIPSSPSALTGTNQVFDGDVPRTPTRLVREVRAWSFDPIDLRSDVSGGMAGSSSRELTGLFGPDQRPDARVTVTMAWSFGPNNGSVPSALPPPTLTPRPPPDSINSPPSSSNTPPSNNTPPPNDPGRTAVPQILSVTPDKALQGTAGVQVAITARATNWQMSTTKFDFGPGVTVLYGPFVTSTTSAYVVLSVASNAPVGRNTVIATTGADMLQMQQAFEIQSSSPSPPVAGPRDKPAPNPGVTFSTAAIESVSPASVAPGTSGVRVTITGRGTHFAGTTSPSFGQGITVASLSVTSPTSAMATLNIDRNAAAGPRTVTFTTGTEVASLANGFSIVLPPAPPLGSPPSPPVASSATSGRYRIILNGFRVNRRTFEGIEGDGPGDEIYATARVQVCKRDLSSWTTSFVKTAVHGNIQNWPERIRGGSADRQGWFGGFVDGDVFPVNQDPARTTMEPVANSFPLLLWEGVLSDGGDVVVLKPILWEADGNACLWTDVLSQDTTLVPAFKASERKDRMLAAITDAPLSAIFDLGQSITEYNYYEAESNLPGTCIIRPGRDRPIGVPQDGGLASYGSFHDVTIMVTREAVENTLRTATAPGGLPAGVMVIPLRWIETGQYFNGDYEAFIRIERVGGSSSPSSPGTLASGTVVPPPGSTPTFPSKDNRYPGTVPTSPGSSTTADAAPVAPTQRNAAPEPTSTAPTSSSTTFPREKTGPTLSGIAFPTTPQPTTDPNSSSTLPTGGITGGSKVPPEQTQSTNTPTSSPARKTEFPGSGSVAGMPNKVPPSSSSTPASPPSSGNYLVTLTAVWCSVPTSDDIVFNRDGYGDEIRAAAVVRQYNNQTRQLLDGAILRTKAYGQNGFPDRIPAGSQTPNGGIKGGDRIPDGAMPARQGPPLADQLPLKLWQGTLTDNDALVISPSVWEDDGNLSVYNTWLQAQLQTNDWLINSQKVQTQITNRAFSPIVLAATEYAASEQSTALIVVASSLALLPPLDLFKTPLDRPIGIVQSVGQALQERTEIPHTVVVLTRAIIEKALSTTVGSTLVPQTAAGETILGVILTPMKPGIMPVVLKDNFPSIPENPLDKRNACYVMTIQVERQ